ncbi:MAG: hypothetical protein A3B08_01765 [Candidatus Taylorbacteria bacterium RIFCSPLOWO2_01_FULL_43_44]|uniref:Uncharacterized protein n=1 Tax=Candidatus Taylorbacteria bacterium RIFCSPHIGHO2_02_FULL_43_32b TaxID=1802306 RepID=A0A1G2MG90_9BACT|nr:MAG: hypothetical protein A2743_02585 [Candidatus Taylorbacteria bacterium RIFCSPHIGHO2_01_FULL_43_47]OHA22897.1 MAG: hypothetical protein A3C72_01635 [Candidatus Taylorbacteria bacterium RIFCSPHIGHO2_02_FULL_43_32b]OHA29860.1 MAG: hypothetical protein A3B08_01765 [Candidatus Taylorbacteria bacterium RIFCSPLOWO2_01_FULL_43_44]
MKKKTKNQNDLSGTLQNTIIPPEIHAEYISYHNKTNGQKYSKEEVIAESQKLLKRKTPTEDKKKIIFRLAHTPVLRAHYAIQKYLKKPDPELTSWAVIAWNESHAGIINEAMGKMFGENDETADDATIMGGLGGDAKRLRYCFVVSTEKSRDITKEEKQKIWDTIKKIDKSHRSQAEKVEFKRNYAKVVSLIPMDVACGTYIEDIINKSNEPRTFLRFHYFVVNTHILTHHEIDTYLKELEPNN